MSEELNLFQKYKKNLGDSRPWHVLMKDMYTSDKIAEERFALCVSCHFFTKLGTCKKCGCLMRKKTKLKNAECPIHKWDRTD